MSTPLSEIILFLRFSTFDLLNKRLSAVVQISSGNIS
ncbi:hypothetical protein PPOLYM_03989 [Paenibacillus polymyxa]|jgi:hypothetical protein|uniref:LysR family transcriptional regulator n=1 Tax=Paenibacillus peoriae TaxID=59893 RepID=A0ABU1Q825_9BACL|nr:hypothetical protein [Paenibacillus sp. PvR133]MDR6775779.1 hypothetical protein [Paenibacillus peoriae]SFR11692.1 hypothetical protein SAMN04488603_103155 [Paenibacillus sp. cl130]VUG07580.1 hypothetical protein PPOLYM_03989 [Paenibacillus polymyxa]